MLDFTKIDSFTVKDLRYFDKAQFYYYVDVKNYHVYQCVLVSSHFNDKKLYFNLNRTMWISQPSSEYQFTLEAIHIFNTVEEAVGFLNSLLGSMKYVVDRVEMVSKKKDTNFFNKKE